MQHADAAGTALVPLEGADPAALKALTGALSHALAALTETSRTEFLASYRLEHGAAAARWLDWAAPMARPPRAKLSRVLLVRLLELLPPFLDADGRLRLAGAIWRGANQRTGAAELRVPQRFADLGTIIALVEEHLDLGPPPALDAAWEFPAAWLGEPLLQAHAESLKRLLALDRAEQLSALRAQLSVVLSQAERLERIDLRFGVGGRSVRVCTDASVNVPVLVLLDAPAPPRARYSPLLPWALGWFVVGLLVGLGGLGALMMWAP